MLKNITLIQHLITQTIDVCWIKWQTKHLITYQTQKIVSQILFFLHEKIPPESKEFLLILLFIVNSTKIFKRNSLLEFKTSIPYHNFFSVFLFYDV